jgi:hypothetical protein
MSNPFLNYGSTGGSLADLQNGLNPIDVAEVVDQSLIPGLPVAVGPSKNLTSRLLTSADLAPGTIPAVTTLTSAGGIQTIVNDGTGPALAVKGLTAGDSIVLSSNASSISIAYDDTRLLAVEDDTQNIVDAVAGRTEFVGAVAAVDGSTPDLPIVASGIFLANQLTPIPTSVGARFTLAAPQTITAIGVPIVHWPPADASVTRRFNIWSDAGAFLVGYDLPKTTIVDQYYVLAVSYALPAGTYRFAIDRAANILNSTTAGSVALTYDPRVSNIQAVSVPGFNSFPALLEEVGFISTGIIFLAGASIPGVIEAPTLKGPSTDPVLMGSDLDFANMYNLLRCPSINGIRPSGGVYSESSVSSLSGPQTTELVGLGVGYGSVTIPANGFQFGDSYALKIGGTITCANTDLFTILIGTQASVFASFIITIDGALVNGWWELELEFIIRALGGPGLGSVITNGNFAYINSVGFVKGIGVSTVQDTTFSTEVTNTLSIIYSTGEASITAFRSSQVILTKLF